MAILEFRQPASERESPGLTPALQIHSPISDFGDVCTACRHFRRQKHILLLRSILTGRSQKLTVDKLHK